MAAPIDFTSRAQAVAKTAPPAAPRLCAWCLGAGKYLEALDGDLADEYIPVVCASCTGTGRQPN